MRCPELLIGADTEAVVRAYSEGVSALQLSVKHGVSLNTVLRRLRDAGVEIRKTGRQPPLVLQLAPEKALRLREIVDGLQLGDGSMDSEGPLRLTQCVKHEPWVRTVQALFDGVGVPCKVIPVKHSRSSKIKGRELKPFTGFQLYTPAYQEFKNERLRWYPRGKKRVPDDVCLTPLSVALWFCGDGNGPRTGTLSFCTQGFNAHDVDLLGRRLSRLVGIRAVRGNSPDGYVLKVLRRDDAVRLRDFMQEHIPEVFRYKLQHVRGATRKGEHQRKLTEAQVREIRASYAPTGSTSARQLAEQFNVSWVTIYNIVNRKIYQWVA
jgi:hypothetical protein